MNGCWSVLLFMLVGSAVGCHTLSLTPSASIPQVLRGEPTQIRDQLLSEIPIGTSRADAAKLAESLGLEVTPEHEMAVSASEMIQCRYTSDSALFGSSMWLIQIDCVDGKVSDVLCEKMGIDDGFF